MMLYSVQSRDQIFAKSCGFLSCLVLKTLVKIIKNLSGKYTQKLSDHTKKSATDALKTSSKRVIQKTAEQLVI